MKYLYFLLLSLLAALPASGRSATVTYAASGSDFANPERGWYVAMYYYGHGIPQNNNLTENSWQSQVTNPNNNYSGDTHQTLVKRIYDLGGIHGGTNYDDQPLDSSFLNDFSADLAAARSLGIKLIVRFDYNEGPIGAPDAPESVIQGHIAQIAPILQANEDVIAYMEAGFIGTWGEWHDSTNGLSDPNNDNAVAAEGGILGDLLTALPTDRMVAVRYPGYTLEIFNTTTPISAADAFNGSNYSRCGTHDDCFESDEYDGGTYAKGTNLGWSAAQFKSFLSAQNYSVQEGGETCGTSSYSTCANSLTDFSNEHWSALHCEYDPSNLEEWVNGGCIDQIDLSLGYRYSLIQSTLPASVQIGATLNLSFEVTNSGWANCYNARGMEVVLRPSGAGGFNGAIPLAVTESVSNNSDPRFWQPGQTYTVSVSVALPPAVTSGSYSVLLNLPDGHASLYNSASNPPAYVNYAIQLANQGVWESADGYNKLGQTLSVVVCAACTPTPSPTATSAPTPVPADAVLATAPLPDPNPTALKALLAGNEDAVLATVYTAALREVATVSTGPSRAGWISLPLPAEFLEKAANGVYDYRILGIQAGKASPPLVGKFMVLH